MGKGNCTNNPKNTFEQKSNTEIMFNTPTECSMCESHAEHAVRS